MSNVHLDPLLIARIVDSGHESAAPEQLRHLSCCRQCLEAYHDVAMIQGMELSRPLDTYQPRLLETPSIASVRRRPTWAFSTAMMALIAFGFLFWGHIIGSPSLNMPEPIMAQLAEQSATGFVVDETANRPHVPTHTVRSGGSDLIHGDMSEVGSDQIHQTLLTMMASGHLDEARALLHSRSAELRAEPWALRLKSVMDYRASRLVEAEEGLRTLLAGDSGDDVARFNLALLLSETGRNDEARTLLDGVETQQGSILRHRAAVLTESLY